MKITIDLKRELKEIDQQRALDFFYVQCLMLNALQEIDSFSVQVEGTNFKRERRKPETQRLSEQEDE